MFFYNREIKRQELTGGGVEGRTWNLALAPILYLFHHIKQLGKKICQKLIQNSSRKGMERNSVTNKQNTVNNGNNVMYRMSA